MRLPNSTPCLSLVVSVNMGAPGFPVRLGLRSGEETSGVLTGLGSNVPCVASVVRVWAVCRPTRPRRVFICGYARSMLSPGYAIL